MKNIKIIGLVALLSMFFLGSCGTSGHANFNKQKYTKLKSKTIQSDQVTEHVASIEVPENELVEPVSIENATAFSDEVMGQNNEVSSTEANIDYSEHSDEQQFHQDAADLAGGREILLGPQLKDRRDFNKLSEEEQNQALAVFDKIFWAGLIMFSLALIMGLIALGLAFLAFSVPFWAIVILGWAAGVLIFSMWIMSLVAKNRVRKIDAKSRTQTFQVKYFLASLVAIIGILICVVTIVGGVILLILYATRVISF